jgi:hypothetical protein
VPSHISLNCGDRRQGQLGLLILVIVQLVLLPTPTAERFQALPDGRIHQDVAERPGGVVAKLPK